MISAITNTCLHIGLVVGKVNTQPNGKSTIEDTNGNVFSCQPGGLMQTRPNGTAGDYELCIINGNIAVYNPVGTPYFFGVA